MKIICKVRRPGLYARMMAGYLIFQEAVVYIILKFLSPSPRLVFAVIGVSWALSLWSICVALRARREGK